MEIRARIMCIPKQLDVVVEQSAHDDGVSYDVKLRQIIESGLGVEVVDGRYVRAWRCR